MFDKAGRAIRRKMSSRGFSGCCKMLLCNEHDDDDELHDDVRSRETQGTTLLYNNMILFSQVNGAGRDGDTKISVNTL